MSTTLTNGLKLPDKGSVDWYADMQNNYTILDGAVGTIADHTTALAGKAPAVHTHTKLDVTDLLNSDFIPSANNSYDLGSSSYQWNNVYSKGYYYNGTAWGLDKENVWSENNRFYKRTDLDGITSVQDTTLAFTALNNTIFFNTKGSSNFKSYGTFLFAGYSSGSEPDRYGQIQLLRSTDKSGDTGNGYIPDSSFKMWRVAPHYLVMDFMEAVRVTNDGTESSLKPITNNVTDLGTSTNQWKSVYSQTYYYNGTPWGLDKANTWTGRQTYGAYIKSFGEARTDDWSSNSRTNAYLLSRRDTDDVSGFLISTFRSNVTQGTAMHIYGWDILENSIRYSGLRFTIDWDSTLNSGSGAYRVTLGTNTQGTNPCNDLHITQLKTINGVNPGALSLPSSDSADYIDLSSNLSANAEYQYTAPYDGWLCLYVIVNEFYTENAIGLYRSDTSANSHQWAKSVTAALNLYKQTRYQGSVMLPVESGKKYICYLSLNANTTVHGKYLFMYKNKGNV